MDEALWTQDPDSWIPHGLDDADGVSHAQTWIMSTPEGNPIAAEFLFLLHGAERADMTSFERVFNLFDGRSDAQVAQARTQWQEWRKDSDLEMRYFAQDDEGKWEKEADQPVRVAIDPFLCRMLACLDLVTCRRRPY